MSKIGLSSIEIRKTSVERAKAALAGLVMAWARDIKTGEPRYIAEIDAEHRGGKCGCECPSCRLPLIAVNAAKDKVVKRPHFRHPEGAQRDECSILAARLAALRLLTEEGVIDLPRRRMSASAEGLSGAQHEAWVEVPAQRVRVASIDFRDLAFAVLTLDDGRKLRVALTGGITEQARSDSETVLIPTIVIDIADASIAGMDQSEIRKRLRLLPDNLCWRSHWSDAELLADAQERATALAIDALDWLPRNIDFPEGMTHSMKRESLLHHKVKRILETAGQITVPGVTVVEELRTAGHPTLQRHWSIGSRTLALTNARLEPRMRSLIPDVVCEAGAEDGQMFDPLVIEVTVTNVIDDERKARIRAHGLAALEIDLSLTGGRVTRSELQRIVVHELSFKSWLHYPDLPAIRQKLQDQMRAERDLCIEAAQVAQERRKRILEAPIAEITGRYLDAVEKMLIEQAKVPTDGGSRADLAMTHKAVAMSIDELAQRGYPEAGDEDLLGYHRILSRLLSIRKDRGIGYRFDTAAGVLNAIRQSQLSNRNDWTLYLIAVKVYLPELSNDQRVWEWFKAWRDSVVSAVNAKDVTYMRPSKYDRLLSLLFPEMAKGLAKPFGKQPVVSGRSQDQLKTGFVRKFKNHDSRAVISPLKNSSTYEPMRLGTNSDVRDWFLRGDELEAWKQANPGAAADWEVILRRSGVK